MLPGEELDLNVYSLRNVLALRKIVDTSGGLFSITEWREVEADPTVTQVEFFRKDVAEDVLGSSSFSAPGMYLFVNLFHSSILFLLQKFRLMMDHPLLPR